MARGGEGGVHDEELERPECMIAFFRLISLSLSLLLPPRSLPALRLEIPPNNPKPTHTHILTHWPTEPFSSPKDFHVVFLSGCNELRHECRHYGWCSALSIIFLSRRSVAALKASNKIKLCQGRKRLCPVNIASTVSWMKECAHCGHKLNAELFFFKDLSDMHQKSRGAFSLSSSASWTFAARIKSLITPPVATVKKWEGRKCKMQREQTGVFKCLNLIAFYSGGATRGRQVVSATRKMQEKIIWKNKL